MIETEDKHKIEKWRLERLKEEHSRILRSIRLFLEYPSPDFSLPSTLKVLSDLRKEIRDITCQLGK